MIEQGEQHEKLFKEKVKPCAFKLPIDVVLIVLIGLECAECGGLSP